MRGMHKRPKAAALPYTRNPQPDTHGYLKAEPFPIRQPLTAISFYWVGAWLRRALLLRSARQSLAPIRERCSREAIRTARGANPIPV
jgi:hypothetical protein